MGGWQRYSLSDGDGLRVVDAKTIPIQAYLGALGMPGVTAWYGLNKIIAPEPNETVLVSAATGAVGSVVGQLAKLAGARAVGIAGGAAKCAYAVRELGYDACVDHRSLRFPEDLKDALLTGSTGCSRMSAANRSGRPSSGSTTFAASLSAASSPLMKASRRRCRTCGYSSSGASKWRAFSRRPPGPSARSGRGAGQPCRRQKADLARDDPRWARKRAAGAGRPAARREFRQDAGSGELSTAKGLPRHCERSEAIQATAAAMRSLACFVAPLLAMTAPRSKHRNKALKLYV